MVTIESNGNFITNITSNPKIYKPKPKKKCISYIPHKLSFKTKKSFNKKHLIPIIKFNFNLNDECLTMFKNKSENIYERSNLQIDKISLEEMQNDFMKLKERKEKKENIKDEEELFYLLKNSLKTDYKDNNFRDTLIIKRPKKCLLENFE